MINQKEFEFHRNIIEWMMEKGTPFIEALGVVSYAEQMNKSIPVAYVDLCSPWMVKDEEKEDY